AAEEMRASFHPRFDARTKTYRYRIWYGDVVSPFERRYAWHVPAALDVGAMERAAPLVEGEHDFAAFQASGSDSATTVRRVVSSRITECGRQNGGTMLLCYEITGTGFLRHMVRSLVGSLVEVGRGKQPPEWIAHLLTSCDRSRAGQTAPALGLFLV